MPVEMWKSHFTVDVKGIVFHNRCGKDCGNLFSNVEKNLLHKVFHISTGVVLSDPVEMWKTQS